MTSRIGLSTPIVLWLGLLLAGCGGGGSGGGGGDGPINDPTGTGEGAGVDTGAVDSGDVDDMAGGEAGGEVGDEDDAGGEDDGDGEIDPVVTMPPEGGGDSLVELSDGRDARVLATGGGPVIGVPGATMDSIANVAVDPGGFVAYAGTYSIRAQSSQRNQGLWVGPAQEPVLLLGGNAEIEGLPPTVRFAGATLIDVASDGSIAALAELSGSRESSAIITAMAGGEASVLVESNATISGLTADKTIAGFVNLARADDWTAIEARTSDNGAGLWLVDGSGEFVAVAETSDRAVNNAPRLGTCRVFVGPNFRNSDSRPAVLDDGTLVFRANLDTYVRDENCASGSAVLRYKGGVYTSVVSPGDTVPGTTESTFGDIQLLGVTADGSAVVYSILSTPTGEFRPDTRWSYWVFPPDGGGRLLALQGEEVQLNGTSETFSGREQSLSINSAGQVAFRSTFENRDLGAALFGGAPESAQPHGAISAPGAAGLTFLLDSSVALPEPFLPSTFFSVLGRPAVDSAGRLVFVGRVTDSELNATVVDALWQVDLEGNLEQLIGTDDTAPVSGVQRPLTDLLQIPFSISPERLQILPLDDQGFVLSDNFGFGAFDSLIYLGPDEGS